MDQQQAEALAGKWFGRLGGNRWRWPQSRSPENEEGVEFAVARALRWLVPDDATAASFDRRDRSPIVCALANTALYSVDVAEILDERGLARSHVIRRPFDSDSPVIEVKATIGDAGAGVTANLSWTFRFSGADSLDIDTSLNSFSRPEPDQQLVLALTERLGWKLPTLPGAP